MLHQSDTVQVQEVIQSGLDRRRAVRHSPTQSIASSEGLEQPSEFSSEHEAFAGSDGFPENEGSRPARHRSPLYGAESGPSQVSLTCTFTRSSHLSSQCLSGSTADSAPCHVQVQHPDGEAGGTSQLPHPSVMKDRLNPHIATVLSQKVQELDEALEVRRTSLHNVVFQLDSSGHVLQQCPCTGSLCTDCIRWTCRHSK